MDRKEFELYLVGEADRLRRTIQRRLPADLGAIMDVDDVLQEVFVSALKSWTPHHARHPYVLAGWLRTITLRRIADCIRLGRAIRERKRRAGQDALHGLMARLLESERPSDSLKRVETDALVDGALAELPVLQRTAVRMMFSEGRRLGEIAARLHTTPTAARGAVYRGLFSVRETVCRRMWPTRN